MARYDEQVLLKGAIRLEVRARQIVFLTAAKYTVISFIVFEIPAFIARAVVQSLHDVPTEWLAGFLALVALLIGVVVGRDRAFDLRLQAQQLLALVRIEHNSRQPILESQAH